MAFPATPKTWVAGDVLTAAQMNAELRDALLAAFPVGAAAWTAYTPTLAQGASSNIAKTVQYSKYYRVGRMVTSQVALSITAAGTAGAPVTITLPVPTAGTTGLVVGSGEFYDASANLVFAGTAYLFTTTTLAIHLGSGAISAGVGAASGGFTSAVASGDFITMSVIFESTT